MTYSVQNTDGSRTINVAASQVNSSFSVALVGRNVSGYGQYFVQNSIRHLENFASTSAPSDSVLLTGQIWYDKNESVMRVYDGSGWQRMSTTVSATAPTGGVASGTTYYSTVDDKLKIHNGSGFVEASYAGKVSNEYTSDSAIGSPTKYGTRLRNMYIADDTGAYRAVLALMYVSDGTGTAGFTNGETIMAIFSDHASFDVHTTTAARVEGLGDVAIYAELNDTTDGIGTKIKPGMNLRKKYAGTAVALANVATFADKANAIYVSGSTYNANTIFRSGSTALIPDTTDSVTIGNVDQRFSTLFIDTIQIGDASSNAAQYIKKAGANVVLDIGESAAPIDNLYVTSISLANGGGISGLNVESFGTSSEPIDTAFISNVASGTFHLTSAGLYGNIVNSGGTTVLNPADGVVAQETTAQTLTNKTLGTVLAANNSQNIGNSGTKFGTVFSSVFDGTQAELTGTSNIAIINGTSATFTGNVGATYFNGIATQAQYADMAEIYSSDVEYAPGTVVKIGGEKEITQTLEHADVESFGVISSNPAYLMNSEANGQPVALAGRVPVKVIGKISKGERLVSSDVPGVAWGVAEEDVDIKAIIGRSLEDKEDGDEGVIEAVIGVK
ncbi:MAG: hypothetical protein CMO97_02310 [Woeseia sp.]|nr:hypothetical protein [Woeseia sp.]